MLKGLSPSSRKMDIRKMKYKKFDIPFYVLFLFFLFLAFYFREDLGKTLIHNTFLMLSFITFSYLFGHGIINRAKVKTSKIIGDGIKSSVLSSKRKELSNGFYAFGLGAFEDDTLMIKSIGNEGIVLVHKNSIEEVFENIKLIGNTQIKFIEEMALDWQDKIKEHFGYLPYQYYEITPFKEYNKIVDLKGETDLTDITFKYVSDLNSRNLSLSVEVNQLKQLIKDMTSTTSKIIQFTSNISRIAMKPWKKELNQSMKNENK